MNKDNCHIQNIDQYVFSIVQQQNILEYQNIITYEQLKGGLINYTFRVFLANAPNVILKYYPPFVASMPDIPLSSSRCFFERQALEKIPKIHKKPRIPRYIGGIENINLMEDKGDLVSLQTKHSPEIIQQIAIWLGMLHECSLHFSENEQKLWDNQHIQQSRYHNQYEYIASSITNTIAQKHLRELGRELQAKGFCITMGDLWPNSILLQDDTFFVIDWEFCHYGRPLQDVAHLCAHFFLMNQSQYCSLFLQKYLEQVSTKIQNDVLSYRATHHFCAEILMRSMGLFQDNAYQNLQEQALKLLITKRCFSSIF